MSFHEDIAQALAARLQTVPGLVTFGRDFIPPEDVDPSKRPAIFLTHDSSSGESELEDGDTVWTKRFQAFAYVHAQSGAEASLNALLSLVEASLLEPGPPHHGKLGGLAEDCRAVGWDTAVDRLGDGLGFSGQAVADIVVVAIDKGDTHHEEDDD